MSRKHFVRLAAELRFERPEAEQAELMALWQRLVNGVADACAAANSHFDRARFLEACNKPAGG